MFVEFSGTKCESPNLSNIFDCDYRPLALTTSYCSDHSHDVAIACPGINRITILAMYVLCIPHYIECNGTSCDGNSMCVYDAATSYRCQCLPGYEGINCTSEFTEQDLYSVNSACNINVFYSDIDECPSIDDCHNCIDLPGSYSCNCNSGFEYIDNEQQKFCQGWIIIILVEPL